MSIVDETGLNERLQRAADPATSPWHLAELADDPDPEIRMVVAANPLHRGSRCGDYDVIPIRLYARQRGSATTSGPDSQVRRDLCSTP
jgi:hypothetical protein